MNYKMGYKRSIKIKIIFILLFFMQNIQATSILKNEISPKNDILTFAKEEWYEKSKGLTKNENIKIDLDKDGDIDILIFKENNTTVVVIDDNDNMGNDKLKTEGDLIDDCYLVDYDGDGLVDRMLDYIDNNKDGIPDEMDIRYYEFGKLKWSWFWEDLDKDGLMFDVSDYQFGSAWKSDMSGNNIFYANKYDSINNTWVPFGESPFSFYDFNNDNKSDAVLRICSTPNDYENVNIDKQLYDVSKKQILLNSLTNDIDYCNNINHYYENIENLKTYATNVRMSYSLSNDLVNEKFPYSYDFGFTLQGKDDYKKNFIKYTNPERREPKTISRIKWDEGFNFFNKYEATATGFSWDEDKNQIKIPAWEGVFWIWERRIINDTGGKTVKYNIRREYDYDISKERVLYYSSIDNRLHLFGADEGWLEISDPFDKNKKISEIRYFDLDKDGYFDRWEYDLDNDGINDRVFSIDNKEKEKIILDYELIQNKYEKILEETTKSNFKIISKMKEFLKNNYEYNFNDRIVQLEKKIDNLKDYTSEKRLYQDLLREEYFNVIVKILRQINQYNKPIDYNASDKFNNKLLEASKEYWKIMKNITEFESLYEKGLYDNASDKLEIIQKEKIYK